VAITVAPSRFEEEQAGFAMPGPLWLLCQPHTCSISKCFCRQRGRAADLVNPGYFSVCYGL